MQLLTVPWGFTCRGWGILAAICMHTWTLPCPSATGVQTPKVFEALHAPHGTKVWGSKRSDTRSPVLSQTGSTAGREDGWCWLSWGEFEVQIQITHVGQFRVSIVTHPTPAFQSSIFCCILITDTTHRLRVSLSFCFVTGASESCAFPNVRW